MERAVLEALDNPINRHRNLPRMAAVLTDGRLFYVGHNQYKTHPLQAKYATHPDRIYLHAEIDALSQAFKYKSLIRDRPYAMYIARVLRNGQLALAKPCTGCLSALSAFGITDIHWTT